MSEIPYTEYAVRYKFLDHNAEARGEELGWNYTVPTRDYAEVEASYVRLSNRVGTYYSDLDLLSREVHPAPPWKVEVSTGVSR